ncbi:MAG: DUF3626 domain-containing protein [Deltaproteobacteria bacterium]|nr:DUF3626 domain-containing protein [Deltaproteobacteria bacterium]
MVAVRMLPAELRGLATQIDELPDTGNRDGLVTPAEMEAARDHLTTLPRFASPEARAAIRRLSEVLVPMPATPASDSGLDIDDFLRPRTVGRKGLYESLLFPAADGQRRERITFRTPQNPRGLALAAGERFEVPRQLVSGSVLAAKIELDPHSRAVVKAEMEGQELPSSVPAGAPAGAALNRALTLVSDAPASIKSVEIIYRPHANLASPDESGDLSRLNSTQRSVIEDVKRKAALRSDEARERLMTKGAALGYSPREIDLVLDYVRSVAPIVVHFKPDKPLQQTTRGTSSAPGSTSLEYSVAVGRDQNVIDAFMVDPHYRNQFETGITSGSPSAYAGGGRDGWEKTIFEQGYHRHPLIASERPKYGAMNASWKPAGPAQSYGACYVILKRGIRNRTTLTPGDSSCARAADVGTAESFAHVLAGLPDQRFRDVCSVALGYDGSASSDWYPYIEAQVHGPIDFAKDVQRLVIDADYLGTPFEAKMRSWAETNGFPVSWHDRYEIHVDGDQPSPVGRR